LHCIRVILSAEVRRLFFLCSLAVFVAAAGATSSARPPALLTYSVTVSSQPGFGVCVARADGTRRLRLTRGKDSGPSWSPRGAYVAFARQTEAGQSRILVADARGRILRRFGTGFSTEPAWSPNGQRIAYASSNGRIVVATTAGRTITQISAEGLVGGPTWSPDSRRIAFAEARQLEQQGALRAIYVVNTNGTGRRLLVGNATDLAWSPNGSKIAYVAYPSRLAETGFVTVANADGTGTRRLTTSGEAESQPAWTRDGRQIAFTRGGAIVVASSAGGAGKVVVRGAVDPAWRPQVLLPQARRAACS
jgi:Tol biopolymer transport system component